MSEHDTTARGDAVATEAPAPDSRPDEAGAGVPAVAGGPAPTPAVDAVPAWPPADLEPDAPEFAVRISRDQVTVVLDCPDPLADPALVAIRIVEQFENLKLPEYPDQTMVAETLRTVATPGRHLVAQPLIMGEYPRQPRDGELVWSRDYFAAGWAVDEETGTMDFWEKLERRSVAQGEVMARIHPPVPGRPGLNVYGKTIGVPKPQRARLRGARGVKETDEDGVRVFTAAIAGRVRVVSGVLSVDDVYVIKADVSLETGNIHHTGCVTIGGDIKTGAVVEAEGDIVVKGMVEPCTIRCGGSLTVAGGIVGDEGYDIEVAGELQARYASEVTVRAGGDVRVLGEIAHSHVDTTGRVLVPDGRIAGGVTVAWKGIRVGEAGASGSARTELAAGIDPTLAGRVAVVRNRARKALSARQKTIAKIRQASTAGAHMTDDQRELVSALRQKMDRLTQIHAESTRDVERMEREAADDGLAEIVIYKEVWSGSILQLRDQKLSVRTSVLKPRLARLKHNRVVLLPLGEGNMPTD